MERRQWIGLVVALSATFMAILDSAIVNVAVPSIQRELSATFGQMQFVLTGYTLPYAVGLVTGGRLGDTFGRKRVFQLGMAGFVLCSLACALAPSPIALICARIAQGGCAAIMLPQVLSMIQVGFPASERVRALGLYGAAIGIAGVSGQIIGGALIGADLLGWGWRWVFLINVPVGLAALVASGPTLDESTASARRLDLAGVAAVTAASLGVLIPLVEGPEQHWAAWTIAVLAALPLLILAVIVVERRVGLAGGDPLVPLRLFRLPTLSFGLVAAVVFYTGNAGLFLILAYHLQRHLGLSPLASGTIFLPLGGGFFLASLASRRLVDRFGAGVMLAGTAVVAAGAALAAGTVELSSNGWLLTPALGLSGVGEGLVGTSLMSASLARVPAADAGAGSGLILTATQTANVLGVAVFGAVYTTVLGGPPGSPAAHRATAAFAATQYAVIGLTVVLALTLLRLRAAGRRGVASPPAGAVVPATRSPEPAGPG